MRRREGERGRGEGLAEESDGGKKGGRAMNTLI